MTKAAQSAKKKVKKISCIIVKYDVGFQNALYIRGEGAGLSWERGIPLTNVSADEWVWETSCAFKECEFKVLINDERYEEGGNHYLPHSASVTYTPVFQQ